MSLLTQFYNCDSGGGGGGSTASVGPASLNNGGPPAIIAYASTGFPAAAGTGSAQNNSVSNPVTVTWLDSTTGGFNLRGVAGGVGPTLQATGTEVWFMNMATVGVQVPTITVAVTTANGLSTGYDNTGNGGYGYNLNGLDRLVTWRNGTFAGPANWTNCTLLSDISTCSFNSAGGAPNRFGPLQILNAKLTVASVERVISCAAASSPTSGKSINLSGGTSAGLSSLSAASQAQVTALIGAGWTITLNAV
jgi:hypothetical protein